MVLRSAKSFLKMRPKLTWVRSVVVKAPHVDPDLPSCVGKGFNASTPTWVVLWSLKFMGILCLWTNLLDCNLQLYNNPQLVSLPPCLDLCQSLTLLSESDRSLMIQIRLFVILIVSTGREHRPHAERHFVYILQDRIDASLCESHGLVHYCRLNPLIVW